MSELNSRDAFTPLTSDRGRHLSALCITSLALCTSTLILRFWSRSTLPKGKKFGADDWAALGAWCFLSTITAVVLVQTRIGYGLPIETIPYANIVLILQCFYVAFITYLSGITLVRISALFFYRRVFYRTNKTVEYLILGTVAFNIIWAVGFILTAIFSCWPVQAYWDRTIPNYTCQPTLPQQLSNGITSVIIDVWVLLLPIPFLWRLQMTMKKRILVVSVFAIGYSVVICTIGRLVSVIMAGPGLNTDITVAFVTPSFWFLCESTVAQCGVSLPAIFHLCSRIRHHGLKSAFTDSQVYDGQHVALRGETSGSSPRTNTNDTPELYLRKDGGYESHVRTGSGIKPTPAKDSINLPDMEASYIRKTASVTVESSAII